MLVVGTCFWSPLFKVYYSFHVEKPRRGEELHDQLSRPETALRDWWIAYPAPSSNVPSLDCDDVATLVKNNEEDYVVIDVRRADYAVGFLLQVTSLRAQISIFHREAMFGAVSNAQPRHFTMNFLASTKHSGRRNKLSSIVVVQMAEAHVVLNGMRGSYITGTC